MLSNLENAFFPTLKGRYVNKFQAYLFHWQAHYSQPSSKMCCGRGWHFRKPVLSIGQYQLKEVYFTKLKSDVKFIR
jgi:hypothetical protein